jgi:CDP-glycerol glycerophosphotransferase (TagB/SpsB family)
MLPYKFLIYISYSYAIPIGNPLEEEIIKRGFTIKWFSDLEEGKTALHNKSNILNDIKEVLNFKPDIILTISDSVPDFINALKVQVFHGFNAEKRSFKKDHFRIRGLFDLYCTQGPSTTSIFKMLQKKHKNYEAIETGWSKADPLFPIVKKSKSTIPTIMIASTFTERLSLAHNEDVYQEIKRLVKAENYNFTMVLHPKIPKHIVDKWAALEASCFTFYNTTNLIPLFKKADIMFADTTSAIQEFLLQKKPVVTFKNHRKEDYLINVEQVKDIENAFTLALTYPETILSKIQSFILDLHPYFDGKSSKRVIDTSIAFLHKDKSYLKLKPLNLIRKYKMRKRLNYFTFKSYNKPFTIKLNG